LGGFLFKLETTDDAFVEAARVAAAKVPLAPSGWPLERDLESALLPALQQALKGCVVAPRMKLDTPTWDPQPRGVDLVVLKDGTPWAAAELKIASVEETLWDLFKLLAVEPQLSATYLVVAALKRKFASGSAYAPLFESSEPKQWQSQELLERWPEAWRDLLAGGSARARRVPLAVDTQLVANEPMTLVRDYEVRVLRVASASAKWIDVTYSPAMPPPPTH
jgi:hypothetical protein